MRVISVLMAGAVLASCTTGPPPPTMRTADAQRQYEQLLVGKVPMAPMSCLPSYRSGDMIRIDDNTILFRDGSSRTYVSHMQGPCNGVATGHYALVTKQFGGTGLCRGDIARVVDTLNGIEVGSCVWGDFVPYVRPPARG